jgi:hypothetical protein
MGAAGTMCIGSDEVDLLTEELYRQVVHEEM